MAPRFRNATESRTPGRICRRRPALHHGDGIGPGSKYSGRIFALAGHEVRILPAQFVKPYLKANKNDFNDAEAIAEAGGRANMRCVPLKTAERLELQALRRVRQRLIIERTTGVNQMRTLLLEHGIVIPLGPGAARTSAASDLRNGDNGLSPRLVALLHGQRQRWLAIDDEIDDATRDLTAWAEDSGLCRRVATVPGNGPIIATAVVAAAGNGRMLGRGARWLLGWDSSRVNTPSAASQLGTDELAREQVPASAVHSRRSRSVPPHEARSVSA